jgi:hypothetical protein
MTNKIKKKRFFDYTNAKQSGLLVSLAGELLLSNRILKGATQFMRLAVKSGSGQLFEMAKSEWEKANNGDKSVIHILDRIEDSFGHEDAYRAERSSGLGRTPSDETVAIRAAVELESNRNPSLEGGALRDAVWERLDDQGYGDIDNKRIRRVIRERKVPSVQ